MNNLTSTDENILDPNEQIELSKPEDTRIAYINEGYETNSPKSNYERTSHSRMMSRTGVV